MNINTYLENQKNEFYDFYNDKNKIIVIAVKDLKVLEDIFIDGNNNSFSIEEYIDDNSYIVNHNNERFELFIKGTYSSYRKRFQKFLQDIYGFEDSFKLKAKINVDHLMNKKRIKDYYIRMILLPDTINQDWGRSYESIICQ